MKNVFVSVIALAIIILLPCRAMGQVSSTAASVGIDAKVIAPISITNTTALNFGTVSRSTASGTVILALDGTRSSTGGATVLSSSSFSAAAFSVTGENSATYSVTTPKSTDAVTLTRQNGNGETMTVTNFINNSPTSLSEAGTATFLVGATLNLGANQIAGNYTGSFSVTVAYQ